LVGGSQGCADNGTYDTDCWRLTTSDGTQYYFGLNKLPGWAAGSATTNSTWTVPVFGNDTGEPCHGTTFAASSCQQAWRWNLDYVVDVHNNAESLYYTAETNHYAVDGTGSTSYTRGGQLDHIDYGLTASNVYAANAATDRVTYGYNGNGRCITGCSTESLTTPTAPATPANYPDVPFDQMCNSATACSGQTSPTFWTDGMLNTVTTAYRSSASAYSTVDTWNLSHGFPDQGDGTNHALILNQVSHTGYSGSTTITEPPTVFTSVALQNRVWPDGYAPLDKFRISSITSPTGAVTSVNYSAQDCQVSEVAAIEAAAATNTRRCYPQYWTPQVTPAVAPQIDLFHKYVVTSIISNPKTGGAYDASQETDYDYTGTPAWKYDTAPTTVEKQRTWNSFAGYNSVRIRVGDPTNTATQRDTEYTFYQGMDGDAASTTGGTKTVFVTGSSTIRDSAWLGGMTRETKILNGAGGAMVSDTTDTPWASDVEATNGALTAHIVGDGTSVESQPTSTGGTRTTTTTTTHEPTYGLPTSVSTVTPDGSICDTTAYAPANTTAWIIGLPQETAKVGLSCADAATATYPKDAISDVRTSYDSHTFGAQPTSGDTTSTQVVDSYAGTTADTAHWSTTGAVTYDGMGRPLTATDALGHTSSTAYTPATGGPLTQTVNTNTAPFSWTSTTVVTPDRGLETSTTDQAGHLTTATYDALGRRTQVWLPGNAQTVNPTNPSTSYAYTETATAPLAVATTRQTTNSLITSYSLYDGLGNEVQTQSLSPAGGTEITDTQHDAQGRISRTNNAYWTTSVQPSTTLFVPTSQQQIPSTTTPVYDGAGRTTATVLSSYGNEVSRTTNTFKGVDEVDTTPPAGGTPTTSISNALGQRTSLTEYLAATPTSTATQEQTVYGYDPSGHMTSMKDPSGNTWTWQYDVLGHNTKAVDPDTGTTTSTYDLGGELLNSTDGRGQVLSYSYDALGRNTAEYNGSTSGSLLKSWTYDTLAKGLPTSSSSYTGSTPGVPGAAYTSTITGYDSGGRSTGNKISIPATAPAFGGTTYAQTYAYFGNGQQANETDPAIGGLTSERVAFAYNGQGEQTSVNGSTTYAIALYTGIGQVAQLERNGTVVDYSAYGYDCQSVCAGSRLDLEVLAAAV